MSIAKLLENRYKPWLNARTTDIDIDGDIHVLNPLNQNNSGTDLLVRNSLDGSIETRDVNSLPGGGGGGNININQINSSGAPGVLYDDGSNIATNNNIVIGGLTAVSLTGANLIILNNPPIDNTIDSVLVRDNAGEIVRRELSSFPFLSNQTVETFDFGSVHYTFGNPDIIIDFMQTGRMITAYILVPAVAAGIDNDYIILVPPLGFPNRLKPMIFTSAYITIVNGTYRSGCLQIFPSGVMNIGLPPAFGNPTVRPFDDNAARGSLGIFITYIGQDV